MAPVLSIRRGGVSMASLRRVRAASGLSLQGYPAIASAIPARKSDCQSSSYAASGRQPGQVGKSRATEVHCPASVTRGGHMADEPSRGLADEVAASAALSDINDRAARRSYPAYDVHDLRAHPG